MANKTFDETFIGTVVKNNKLTREVAVFIPRLMSGLYDGEATDYKVPTNSGLRISTTNTNISSTITKSNYIWVKARNMDDPLPKVGSKVYVIFLDDRPSLGLWWKCNINGDYEVIDDEKYERQFSIDINDAHATVYRDDNIIINLPDYFRVTADESDENKIPTYNIYENYNFYKPTNLEESIINLQKSMEYIEGEYKNTFIGSLTRKTFTPNASEEIAFPTAITSYRGSPRVADEDLPAFKLYLNSELDDIYTNIATLYPLLYRQTITDSIRNTKHALDSVEDPKDTKYWQIVWQFYNELSKYNFNLSGFLTNSYSKILEKSKTQIKLSQNLLSCAEIFNAYDELLQGLIDTYTLYNTYITNYNNISDTTILQELSAQHITKDIINSNIIIAFERAYDSIDIGSITDYIKYIKTLFPTSVKVTYTYSNNGLNNNMVITEDTHKLFETYGSTIYQPLDDNGNDDEIIPIEIEEPDATLAYDSTIYDWVTADTVDENNKISITHDYYLTHDITVEPQLLFAAIVYDEDLIDEDAETPEPFDLVVWDNIPNSSKTYTYKINNVSKTIEEVKEYINDISHTSYTITVTLDTIGTEVNITYANTTFYANIVKELLRYIETVEEDKLSENPTTVPDYENLYNTYKQYDNIITTYNITHNLITYTDDDNNTHTYDDCVNTIKTLYGDYASDLVRKYIYELDKYEEDTDEYDECMNNAVDAYDYYNNICILNLTTAEKAKIGK